MENYIHYTIVKFGWNYTNSISSRNFMKIVFKMLKTDQFCFNMYWERMGKIYILLPLRLVWGGERVAVMQRLACCLLEIWNYPKANVQWGVGLVCLHGQRKHGSDIWSHICCKWIVKWQKLADAVEELLSQSLSWKILKKLGNISTT